MVKCSVEAVNTQNMDITRNPQQMQVPGNTLPINNRHFQVSALQRNHKYFNTLFQTQINTNIQDICYPITFYLEIYQIWSHITLSKVSVQVKRVIKMT